MIDLSKTIAAPATIPGSGAVSVLRISGPDALKIADSVVKCRRGNLSGAAGYTAHFGTVSNPDGSLLDEVIATVFRSPHSYTGEDSVEISCHASRYIAEAILGQLMDAGATSALPGEFTQRAFLNGKMDLAQAEAVADLISSQNSAAHRVAMNQLKGGFSSELMEMRAQLLKIVSLMELELDFSEDDVEFADRSELLQLVETASAHCDRLASSFKLGNAIKNGIPVAIVGATNSGKSTLLNAIVGEDRAIVSDIAGTTRDTIEEPVNIGGTLFRFIDTAGIRETSESVEKIGIERTFKKISEADIVFALLDTSLSDTDFDVELHKILDAVSGVDSEVILVLNKVDLAGSEAVNKKVRYCNGLVKYTVIQISAKERSGLQQLYDSLADFASKLLSGADNTLVTNLRHAQELTLSRDALLRVRDGLNSGLPSDLVAQDIRDAIAHIGSITGEISTDEVFGEIFSHFCIGK